MPLEDFAWLHVDAARYPKYDSTNDNCSGGGVVTGNHAGYIRHDFLYRDTRRIDYDFELGGDFQSNAAGLKHRIDRRLDQDIDGVFGVRGFATSLGLSLFGGGFYEAYDPMGKPGAVDSPYGDSPAVALPPLRLSS